MTLKTYPQQVPLALDGSGEPLGYQLLIYEGEPSSFTSYGKRKRKPITGTHYSPWTMIKEANELYEGVEIPFYRAHYSELDLWKNDFSKALYREYGFGKDMILTRPAWEYDDYLRLSMLWFYMEESIIQIELGEPWSAYGSVLLACDHAIAPEGSEQWQVPVDTQDPASIVDYIYKKGMSPVKPMLGEPVFYTVNGMNDYDRIIPVRAFSPNSIEVAFGASFKYSDFEDSIETQYDLKYQEEVKRYKSALEKHDERLKALSDFYEPKFL